MQMIKRLEQRLGGSVASFLRYGLVGLTSNLVGFLAYLMLTSQGLDPKIAMTILYVIACSIGFYGNRQWTFGHRGNILRSALRFFAAHLMGYLINLSVLLVFVDHLGFRHEYVQAVAIFLVAGFLYVAFRFFVFPRQISDGELAA